MCRGDYLSVEGVWVDHPVHKRQFKVSSFSHLVPKTNEELQVFLSSGVIAGIGPHFAELMIKAFGDELVSVLDESPDRLLQVEGIGKKIKNHINVLANASRSIVFLQYLLSFDIDVSLAKRIWNTYYSESFDVCQQTPYRLIEDIKGVNFLMADRIAGLAHQVADARFMAAIRDVFDSYLKTSNVWMQFDDFSQFLRRLQLPEDDVLERLQQYVFSQLLSVVVDGDFKWVTLPIYSDGELAIMNGVDAFIQSPLRVSIDAALAVSWVVPRLAVDLSPDQVSALEGICSHSVSILYGGPGTGKTSLLRAYVDIVSKKTNRILCMAPTGKAAKRLGEQVGRRASTIHAMMELDEHTNALTPKALDVDVCIIDEMSMVDMMLFQDVLRMLPLGVRLVLVGDPDQLPSIGPGQVFADMIQYSRIPSFKLSTNHRQVTHRGLHHWRLIF